MSDVIQFAVTDDQIEDATAAIVTVLDGVGSSELSNTFACAFVAEVISEAIRQDMTDAAGEFEGWRACMADARARAIGELVRRFRAAGGESVH